MDYQLAWTVEWIERCCLELAAWKLVNKLGADHQLGHLKSRISEFSNPIFEHFLSEFNLIFKNFEMFKATTLVVFRDVTYKSSPLH